MEYVEVQITIKESHAGRRAWHGEFIAQSVDGILPDERLALILDNGENGTARVNETCFDSRFPEVTTIHFTGTSPLLTSGGDDGRMDAEAPS